MAVCASWAGANYVPEHTSAIVGISVTVVLLLLNIIAFAVTMRAFSVLGSTDEDKRDYIVALAVIATLAALLLHWVVFRLLRRVVGSTRSEADEMLVRRLAMPTRFALVALALVLTAREIPAFETVWERVAGFVMPAVIGWIALAILQALTNRALDRDAPELLDGPRAAMLALRIGLTGR